MQARAHRADRALEHARRFRIRQLLQLDEHERLAIVDGQPREGGVQPLAALICDQALFAVERRRFRGQLVGPAALEAQRDVVALTALLGLDAARAAAFTALTARDGGPTYREAISVLSPDPEGTYFLYRFSDPTFVMAEALLVALAQEPSAFSGPVLDLCGGSGHLTRVLTGLQPHPVVLADTFFWKLWLAKAITAPAFLWA